MNKSDEIIAIVMLYLLIAFLVGVFTEKKSSIWWPILIVKIFIGFLIWLWKALIEAIKN